MLFLGTRKQSNHYWGYHFCHRKGCQISYLELHTAWVPRHLSAWLFLLAAILLPATPKLAMDLQPEQPLDSHYAALRTLPVGIACSSGKKIQVCGSESSIFCQRSFWNMQFASKVAIEFETRVERLWSVSDFSHYSKLVQGPSALAGTRSNTR